MIHCFIFNFLYYIILNNLCLFDCQTKQSIWSWRLGIFHYCLVFDSCLLIARLFNNGNNCQFQPCHLIFMLIWNIFYLLRECETKTTDIKSKFFQQGLTHKRDTHTYKWNVWRDFACHSDPFSPSPSWWCKDITAECAKINCSFKTQWYRYRNTDGVHYIFTHMLHI